MAVVEAWCDQCDAPASTEFRLASGRIVAKCPTHAWAYIAPDGRIDRPYREARTVNADFDRMRMAAICGLWIDPHGNVIDLYATGGQS